MKKIKVIKILFSIIVLIVSMLGILNIINRFILIRIMLIYLGIMCFSNGYSSYIKNKKRETTFLILAGIVEIFVFVNITFFLVSG